MKLYTVARPLYLETDTSGSGIGTSLLQVRDGMNWGCDETPDSAILTQLHLPVKAYPMQSGIVATYSMKPLRSFMG